MKRVSYAVLLLLSLLAVVWVTAGNASDGARYKVADERGGPARLLLTDPRPGLFVDVVVPVGSAVQQAFAGGRPAPLVRPWPGTSRRRVLAFWRGPVELVLEEGAGPFRLTGRPEPVHGRVAALQLPDGWQQAGLYAGRLQVVAKEPLVVAVPVGVTLPPGALERVSKLYTEAGRLAGTAPPPGATVVLTGPDPVEAARAVVDLWLPAYDADGYWWQKGAREFYAGRLLDRTSQWGPGDKTRWQKERQKDKEYMLVAWLDASIRVTTRKERSVDDMYPAALSVRTHKALLELVKEVGGLGTADRLDRMLRGREPLPSTNL